MNNDLLQKIHDATNDGLDIILYYYPQAHGCDRPGKYFKIRSDERTASACMKKIKGVWRVTDFGDESRAMSPVNICMKEEGKEFREALLTLAQRYGVNETINASINKPVIEQRDAAPEEKEGSFDFKIRDEMTREELALLGPLVTQEVCDKYSYYALEWFRTTNNRKTTTIRATDTYPVFMHDCGGFKKIYQPLAAEKKWRFQYQPKGMKSRDYINGLDVLKEAYEKWQKENDEEQEIGEAAGEAGQKRKKKSGRLPEAILCSGERDALNTAGLGYLPIWLNSESADLPPSAYAEIMKKVETLYNLPDTDSTGLRMAGELARKFIDIRTIELPGSLGTYRDSRGNPRKDMRDWVDTQMDGRHSDESEEQFRERRKREKEKTIRKFKEMMEVAKPCKFWEKTYAKGKPRYEINSLYLLHFLEMHGFGQIAENHSDAVRFVKVEGFTVRETTAKEMKNFITRWAEERKLPPEIQNLIINSTRTGGAVFENIACLDLDFRNFNANSQTLFFEDRSVTVTAESVTETHGAANGVKTWEKGVCHHRFRRLEPSVTPVFDTPDGMPRVKINSCKSHFMRFLVATSRMYWKKEFEDEECESVNPGSNDRYRREHHWDIAGPRLSRSEADEQNRHLANKMFAIGYLMHSYKSLSRPWAVWLMENRVSEENESGGGSGKTFMLKMLSNFKDTEMINGRDRKLTEGRFFLDRVSEGTDIVRIDDAEKYFNFNYFYSMITDNMIVEGKNVASREIDFSVSPKFAVTSNFPPPASDGSTLRRLLTCVVSDYYHKATDNGEYMETRTIADDFGYELYNESYREEWWNEDLNVCVDCLQFYLQCAARNLKVDPPMSNVEIRMNNQVMGEEFRQWAEIEFSPEGDSLDRYMLKEALINKYNEKHKTKPLKSSQQFKKKMAAFCKNAEHIEALNPSELKHYKEKEKRITIKIDGKLDEYIYVKSYDRPLNEELPGGWAPAP
ncbi:MAG: hypothetical protein IJQ54_00535 [Kiritimatiellae bacterium]|nr:hypothetical protein [Kiritimatiellia bacterium]